MIYICIRQTTDWEDEAVFNAQLPEALRPKIEQWNATFNIPYHLFRARLKRIAQDNLAQVNNAIISGIDNVPEGAWVVPIDDDDWLAPHIAAELEVANLESRQLIYWQRHFLNMPVPLLWKFVRYLRYGLRGRDLDHWTCSTNNYAFIHDAELYPEVFDHWRASHFVDSSPDQVRYLDRALSIMNRSIASQTAMGYRRPTISSRRLRINHRLYRDSYNQLLVGELAWANPYREQMATLMSEMNTCV